MTSVRRTMTILLATMALVATGIAAGLAVGGSGTVDPPPRIAFLANGIVPADALAAGGIAGQLGAPLFTTTQDVLQVAARDGLVALDPELVIVLGGPVAISDAVVAEVADATGLTVTTAEAARDGIVRVAGGDRYETARAVAELLTSYAPAYLPVGATARGAVDADLLDGLDATAFALADRACTAGQVVTGIAADGTPTCTAVSGGGDGVDGGDAETLDGLDSTAFALADQACTAGRIVTGIAVDGTPTCAADAVDGGDAATLGGFTAGDFLRGPVEIRIEQGALPDGGEANVIASCDPGESRVGGGASISVKGSGGSYLTRNAPFQSFGREEWQAIAINEAGGGPATLLSAYVLCVPS